MTPDGTLAFLALTVALYTVAPVTARLKLRLQSILSYFFSATVLLGVLYLQFFDTIAIGCTSQLAPLCEWLTIESPRTPKASEFAYLLVLSWLAITLWSLSRNRLPNSAIPPFADLVGELADEGRFGELIKFVEPHVQKLDDAASRKLPHQKRYDWIAAHSDKATPRQVIGFLNDGRPKPGKIARLAANVLVRLLPADKRSERAANEALRRILRTGGIRKYIAEYRPDVGVKLLGLQAFQAGQFSDDYLATLVASTDSSLYEEIYENQNCDPYGPYWVPPRNRLLYFLFNDPKVAERLGVYRPLGEYVLSKLRADMHPNYASFLNGSARDFDETERWRDPTFVCVRFFDIMVHAALQKSVQWHMWLYYFQSFTDSILEFYDANGPGVDQTDEWPTRASYLLYAMMAALRDWVIASVHLPNDNPHRSIDRPHATHDNGNIPKSALLCMGGCLRDILLSAEVPDRFKRYLVDITARMIDDISGQKAPALLRTSAINAIIAGGVLGPDPAYGQVLKNIWQRLDPGLQMDLSDFENALLQQYP